MVSILCNGSRNPTLHQEAVDIFRFCQCEHIELFAQWIPRGENTTADYLSRILDMNDWAVFFSAVLFVYFDKTWGPHTVDRFASHLSHQLPTFNSLWWSPGSSGVDCFTWEGESNWCLPPPPHLSARFRLISAHIPTGLSFWAGTTTITLSCSPFLFSQKLYSLGVLPHGLS